MKVIVWPSPILTHKPELVTPDTFPSEFTLKGMYELLKTYNGLGLSAVQVGIPLAFFVAKIDNKNRVFINPTCQKTPESKMVKTVEGCLSFPGQFETTNRWDIIELCYTDYDTKEAKVEILTGLDAQIAQHEENHCHGKLWFDYMDKAAKSRIIGNLLKRKK